VGFGRPLSGAPRIPFTSKRLVNDVGVPPSLFDRCLYSAPSPHQLVLPLRVLLSLYPTRGRSVPRSPFPYVVFDFFPRRTCGRSPLSKRGARLPSQCAFALSDGVSGNAPPCVLSSTSCCQTFSKSFRISVGQSVI